MLATLARQRWWVLAAVATIAVALGMGIVLSFDLARQTQELVNRANAIPADQISPKDRADLLRNAFQYQADNLAKLWTGIIGIFTGIAAVAAGVIAWRNLRVAQENLEEAKRKAAADQKANEANLEVTHKRLDVDREAQITNRFTQAIGQLGTELKDGKPNLEVRLGGIYALERIARDSPRDRRAIMQVLTAYVRGNARWDPRSARDGGVKSTEDLPLAKSRDASEAQPLRVDIQAILTVVTRISELSKVDLHAINDDDLFRSTSARLDELGRIDLQATDLRCADLRGGYLVLANFRGACLEGADLSRAHLELADLSGAILKGANFQWAHLEGDVQGIRVVNGATLQGASLQDANLAFAIVEMTHFESSDVTQEQLYAAFNHGEGAVVSSDWPSDWRDRVRDQRQRSATSAAPSSATESTA